MAGTYPDIPANRFVLEQDGTKLYRLSNDLATSTESAAWLPVISDTDADYWELNNEGSWGGAGRRGWICVVFPELRDIVGFFINLGGDTVGSFEMQYSTDSVDGISGTWTNGFDNFPFNTTISPYYRTGIDPVNWLGVKAIRFGIGRSVYNGAAFQARVSVLHLYGSISSGQNPDRLRFWHPLSDIEAPAYHFDFGDVPQGTTHTKQFRIKNNSATLTANDIVLTRVSQSAAELQTGLQFSIDGAVWADTVDIGDLGPGAISPILRVRRIVGPTEEPSIPRSAYLMANATSWV